MTTFPHEKSQQWKIVAGAYKATGLTPLLDATTTPSGYVYDNGVAALAGDPVDQYCLGLHDLAHYLLSPPSRRNKPNFGLGCHPSTPEPKDASSLARGKTVMREEAAGSLLNILLAEAFFGREKAKAMGEFLGFPDFPGEEPVPTMESLANQKCLRKAGLLAPTKSNGAYVLTLPKPLQDYMVLHRV